MPIPVALVVFPGFQVLDAAGPASAFEAAERFVPGSYQVTLLSAQGGLIQSSGGISLLTQPYNALEHIDTLLTVGGDGIEQASRHEPTLNFLRAKAEPVRRIGSVCSGAYLLAAAGLLNNKKATTHWRKTPDFCQRFPQVQLQPDRIYINDGKIWTSAGITAGIDLTLALIAQDLGDKVARQVAQQLVVYYRRPGGQTQYSALLEMDTGTRQFANLLDYIRANLQKPLSVNDLAEQACISPRHFARKFTAEVGTTPARAVERLRVEAASLALEGGQCSVQQAARQYGFTDPERMRRAFIRLLGVSPSALRQRARD